MTEENHLKLWDRFADIDPKFTKPISGKDYSGTSPNAHYIIKCLTELFGPVGIGFGWRVVAEGIEKFDSTSIHWCRIEFWHAERTNTFEAYGQTKMAYMTRQGSLKVDEDAPKKSLTDAITKAAAQIGIASNIFLGRWDDNKYVQEVNQTFREAEKPKAEPREVRDRLKAALEAQTKADVLAKLWKQASFVEAYDNLPEPMRLELSKVYNDKFNALTPPDPAMQGPGDMDEGHQYQ